MAQVSVAAAPVTIASAALPSAAVDQAVSKQAAVRAWLYGLAALVVLMVAVGGATRLTGSGLSITEWRPVTGAIPPLTHEAWLAAFDQYRAIPQYQLLNKGMTLSDFQFIYWWEWSHRQLGRVIGLAFFLPLAFFWFTGAVRGRLALALLGLGALGGFQAAIGWIMVASGLQPGMTAVAPIKLTLHLTTASVILAGLVWISAGLRPAPARPEGTDASRGARALLALVFLQIALGGLVAGSKAGLTYNTWPLMDGQLVPPAAILFSVTPWIENFVDNLALVQFNHRLVAYLLVAVALWHAVALTRRAREAPAARRARALAGMTLAQAVLGIVTLLLVVPLWAGLAHQVFAMAVLVMATVHTRLSLGDAPQAAAARA
ncbi:MAG TPA: COX15/CtaA family protein [Beijerinckiaceae bacterium]|jgi:cytochrome c oxidase assembly protein subunit 15